MSIPYYTLDILLTTFKPLFPDGLPDKAQTCVSASPGDFTGWQEYEGDINDISEIRLPAWMQDLLDAVDVGDASREFFRLCIGLFDHGCTADCIIDIMESQVSWLPKRYYYRLDHEVYRCLAKFAPDRPAVLQEPYLDFGSDSIIKDIPLAETDDLSSAFRNMLDRYCDAVGYTPDQKLIQSCRFLEEVYGKHKQSVIIISCGGGKSSHAVAHMAVYAEPDNQFVFVVRDRDAITEVTDTFSKLFIPVGIYTGFSDIECHKLTGKDYKFEQCLRGHKDSKCLSCSKQDQCWFYQSETAFLHYDIVVITHASFIIQCEKGRNFSTWSIIIDENPAVFTTEEFTVIELLQLRDTLWDSAFPNISDLLENLFPFVEIRTTGTVNKDFQLTELREIKLVHLAEKITPEILRTLFRFSFSEGLPEYLHPLFFRFLLFIRTAVQCGASLAVAVLKDRIVLKKQRLDFRVFCTFRRLFILDASSDLSQLVFPDGMPVLTCFDLEKYRTGLVRLHLVIGSPTKSRRESNTEAGLELIHQFMADTPGKSQLLLSHNHEPFRHKSIMEALSRYAEVHSSSIGYLRGTNKYDECMMAFFASTGVFTSIQDCALSIALEEQMDISWSRFMQYSGDKPVPKMDAAGRFIDPAMQRIYMCKCIDTLYQAAYRTAVRKGETVDIFMPVPSLDWLITLQQIMPCEVVAVKGSRDSREKAFLGVSQLVNLPAGTKVSKKEAAELCGYASWKKAKRTLKHIYRALFENTDSTVRVLTRKEIKPC